MCMTRHSHVCMRLLGSSLLCSADLGPSAAYLATGAAASCEVRQIHSVLLIVSFWRHVSCCMVSHWLPLHDRPSVWGRGQKSTGLVGVVRAQAEGCSQGNASVIVTLVCYGSFDQESPTQVMVMSCTAGFPHMGTNTCAHSWPAWR